MKNIYKITALALALTILLSGCSYIDGNAFEILKNGANTLFSELNPSTSDVEGVEEQGIYTPPQSSSSEDVQQESSQTEPVNQDANKFWDYGNNYGRFKTVSPYDYYGRNQLPIEHRQVYDDIVLAINNLEQEIKVNAVVTSEVATKILMIVFADYPQIFWVKSNYTIYTDENEHVTSLKLNYSMNSEQKQQKISELYYISQKILNQIPTTASDYEKSLILHDTIVNMTKYDQTKSLTNSFNLLGTLIDGVAVCQSYAKAYQYMLYQVGIEALYVKGFSKGEPHAWNIARLDGEYYHTDITWDDPVSRETNKNLLKHTYVNITDAEILVDHTIDVKNAYALPVCNATKNNYFVKENLAFKTLDRAEKDRLAVAIADKVKSGEKVITIKLLDFDYLYKELTTGEVLFDCIDRARKKYGAKNLNSKMASVSKSKEQKTMTITLIFK